MMEINGRVDRQKLASFKVIFDLFIFCFYFIQLQKHKLYYATLMKAPADFSHDAILAKRISLTPLTTTRHLCITVYE